MAESFGLYSQYYDLLYQDKDYEGEAAYVLEVLKKYAECPIKTLLELGSGTGIHASLLAKTGIYIHGVELSESMIDRAKERSKGVDTGLTFHQGDARTYRTDSKFDAVLSLFHVLSYQTLDSDLKAVMNTASVHLEAGGIFVFDFWYGPAVLSQLPSIRVKRWENSAVSIIRIAEPVIDDSSNVVNVNYTIFSTDKKTNQITKIHETHKMRYLFQNEIDLLLKGSGFSRVMTEEWMIGSKPSINTWGVCVVARKN